MSVTAVRMLRMVILHQSVQQMKALLDEASHYQSHYHVRMGQNVAIFSQC